MESPKKEKKEKKDKDPSSASKDKAASKDKESKEKKDKDSKEKKDKDKSASKEKKDKSASKEKKKSKDAVGSATDASGAATESKDVKVAGATTYHREKRVSTKSEGKTKTEVLWIPEGKTASDKDFVFREAKDTSGGRIFIPLSGNAPPVWALPDIGGDGVGVKGPSASATSELASASASQPGVSELLQKKKFKEKKKWKDEAAKKSVTRAVEKAFASRKASLTTDEYKIIAANVAGQFMSENEKLDADGAQWIADAIEQQTTEYLALKADAEAKAEEKRSRDMLLTQELKSPEDAPLPSVPSEIPTIPASKLLPKMTFLKDPYYTRRLHLANPRRTTLEQKMDNDVFYQPGGGVIKTLCAVGVRFDQNTARVACVVRDWVGAFCLMFVVMKDDREGTVDGAYPILSSVELSPITFTEDSQRKKVFCAKIILDDCPFTMYFAKEEHIIALRDALKLACCSMYGTGSDDARIITMRAHSVEFSSFELNYYPNATLPDAARVHRAILNEDQLEGEAMDDWFLQLRLLMRTPEGRDQALRSWCQSVDEGGIFKRRSPAMVQNHLRFIDEANRSPTFHDDASLASSVVMHLTQLSVDQPRDIKERIEACKATCRTIEPVMERWRSRSEKPDVPFEKCFEAVDGSVAAQEELRNLAKRRKNHARSLSIPGIYLTMLCYCENSVLCDSMNNLFQEVIVPYPTENELNEFTAGFKDFRWALTLGAANENWALEIHQWFEIYDNVGRGTFRAKFLSAARRLLESQHFQTLGYIFDVPIVQKQVSCAHVLCVLKLDSRDRVPSTAGQWRSLEEFESSLYIQSLMADGNSRLSFLPTSYYNCVRFVQAAIDGRESLDKKLQDGFYLGMLFFTTDSEGSLVLVPEGNRFLPPLALVSDEMPNIEQWKWMQGLNERKKRSSDFGFETTGTRVFDTITFEQRFAKAVNDLEKAVGAKIEKFYDYEMFTLNETQTVKCFFATGYIPQSFVNDTMEAQVPHGDVPMVWKHVDVVEDTFLRLYWPTIGAALLAERNAHFRRAYKSAHPFTLDDVVRTQHDSSLLSYYNMCKFTSLLSWLRPVFRWCVTDGRHFVAAFGGEEDLSVARSVEESVEIAGSNYSSRVDLNLNTMKALLFDAASASHLSWDTLLRKLLEADRVMNNGYATRVVTEVPKSIRERKLRTYDELEIDESDDETMRPPTVYELPCTLEELIFKDSNVNTADKYFIAQSFVQEAVERACGEGVDVGNIKQIGTIIADMISIIESTEQLVDGAALLSLKQETEDKAWNEREAFQQRWLEVFQNDTDQDIAGGTRKVTQNPVTAEDARALEAMEEAEDEEGPMSAALYYDGSRREIRSFAEGVRVCLCKAMNSAHQLDQLLQVANSCGESLEFVQVMQDYTACVNRRSALLGQDSGASGTTMQIEGTMTTPGDTVPRNAATGVQGDPIVTIVSKDYQEFPLQHVNPLCCLVLHGVTGKIRFPTISSGSMELLADHLKQDDFTMPQHLAQLKFDAQTTERLLEMSTQMKAPLLALRFATVLFATQSGPSTFFTATAALHLRGLFQNSFLFEYAVKDWLHMEALGGEPLAAAFDVLWWIRFLQESADAGADQRKEMYPDHEGSWKQVYSETRVRVFLSFGVHAVSKDEVTLWAQSIGRYVEYLSLRDTSIGDPEIEVLVQCCPNIKSLDFSYTSVTGRSVDMFIENCRSLVECAFAGCDLSPQEQEALKRLCNENRRRMV